MTYSYDLIVIGAGSGGLAAAKRAASYGKRVAIIEASRTGGTCVIRGCVPKKIMSYAAAYADHIKDAAGYGFNIQHTFDFATFAQKRNDEVARLETLHKNNLKKAGVELYLGKGALSPNNPHEVIITNEEGTQTLDAAYIILATGSSPFIPPLPGHEHAISSDGVFDLTTLPKKMAIIGGGYIGVEFASIFNALGVDVSLVVRRKTMLGGFDQDLRQSLTDELVKRGINFECICNVEKIEALKNGQKCVTLDNGNTLEVDVALFATGRKPNIQGLNLEQHGITLDSIGAIKVTEDLRTISPHDHIFAIGDLTNRMNLTPVAVWDGRMVADNLFNGTERTMYDAPVGTAVFSIPPVGTVGLGEDAAIEKHGKEEVASLKIKFRPMINVLAERDEKMLMKVVYLKTTKQVIGAHLMGRDAPEMIQTIAMALTRGLTLEEMNNTMPIHPTSAEEFVLLKE